MPLITFDDTLACLAVEPVGAGRYTGPNIPMAYRRVFGGQLLAQTIAVATRDANTQAQAQGKHVKSLHATLPREGDLEAAIEYEAVALQDGRSFASRQVTARQGDRVIASAIVSLHVDEEGPSHQEAPPDVGSHADAKPTDLSMIPWETRVVGGVDLESRDEGPAEYAFFMRAPDLGDAPRATHQALFAHATDLTLIGTALRPHAGLSEADSPERLHTAVTTHTVWFHRPFRLDDWTLLCQSSPVAAGARAFGRGNAFDARGDLVASFAQEAMIRPVA